MKLNVLTGCLATVWQIVCSPQPIFNVFVQNQLGASASTLGALVGLIQLTGVFQLASIFVYGYSRRKKPFFVAAHLVHRILTLAIAAAAFVAAARGDRSWGVRAIMVAVPLSWAFMNASSAGWWSWVADLFPENMRGAFFLKRSALINVVNVVWFFLASMVLDIFQGDAAFWAYGAIFLVGAASGIVDIVVNLFIPEPVAAERPSFSPKDALAPLKDANFVRFAAAVGAAIFSINLILPFQAPYVVASDKVGAPATWLGIMFVISQLTWVLTAPFWGTVMDKWGRKPVVVLGCFYTLAWTGYLFLTPRSFTYLLPLISIGVGLLSPAFWEGINQMMLSLTPEKNRIAFVAWYMTIVGVVSAGGSVAGGALFDALAGVSFDVGPLRIGNFHIVQALSIAMVAASAFVVSRVREGRERSIGWVVGRVANPGILKTYVYLDYLVGGNDPSQAGQALRAMEAETGDLAVDEIAARLGDPYFEVREEAARALGRLGTPQATEALLPLLTDGEAGIRVAAARALGKIRDPRATEPLLRIVAEGGSEELLEACVQALGDIGGDRAAEGILQVFRTTRSDRLRACASDAAGRVGLFEAAREIYPRLLAARSAALRAQYAIAIGNMLGEPGGLYPLVSGSQSGRTEKTRKLFARMEANLRSAARKMTGRDASRPVSVDAQHLGHAAVRGRAVLAALEEGRDDEALREMASLAEELLDAIFGPARRDDLFQEFAFRLDPPLGAFAWLLSAAKDDPPRGEARRLVVLLIAFFLAEY